MEEEIILMEENDIEEINIEEENYSGKPYKLPIASAEVLGGIKVGENLTIDEDGTLNAQASGSVDLTGYAKKSEIPTNVSQLTNDKNYINQIKTINGQTLIGEGDIKIESGSGSNITNNVYSKEEQVIGTYFGKPLYRKVLKINALPSTTKETMYAHGIENLEIVTNIYGTAILDQGNGSIYQMILPYCPVTGLENGVSVSRSTAGNIAIQCGKDRSIWNAEIVLEYTKTTD
jgi:hypothetical protein